MCTKSLMVSSLLVFGLVACSTSKSASQADSGRLTINPTNASPEDCKRRAAEMARQEHDMRSGPQELVDTSAPPPKSAEWNSTNNPCPETASSGDSAEDKLLVRTQIDSALQSQNYARARVLLPKLYTSPMAMDPALQALTQEVLVGHTPLLIAAHTEANSIIMRDEQPVCTATRAPHAIHDDYDSLSELVEGDTIHIYCGVPNSGAPVNVEVRVRYRLSTGNYAEIARKQLGALPDLTVDDGVHVTMTLPQSFLDAHDQAYMEVVFMGLTPGNTADVISKGSFFWTK